MNELEIIIKIISKYQHEYDPKLKLWQFLYMSEAKKAIEEIEEILPGRVFRDFDIILLEE